MASRWIVLVPHRDTLRLLRQRQEQLFRQGCFKAEFFPPVVKLVRLEKTAQWAEILSIIEAQRAALRRQREAGGGKLTVFLDNAGRLNLDGHGCFENQNQSFSFRAAALAPLLYRLHKDAVGTISARWRLGEQHWL